MHDVVSACVERAVRTYPRSGIVVGVLRGGEQQVFGYGTIGIEQPRLPDGDIVFEIASITKVFTAVLLAASVHKGLVELDAPAAAYLPPSVHLPDEVTLLTLATHTSGLPRLPGNIWRSWLRHPRNPYTAYTERHLLAVLSTSKPQLDRMGRFHYSNLGGGLLGYILARVQNLPYEDAVRRDVCDPLGLSDTSVTLSTPQRPRFAPPRTPRGRLTPAWDLPVLAGAGALRSTAHDLLRFLRANLGDAPAELADALQMCQAIRAAAPPPMRGVGLGWMVSRFGDDGAYLHWHDGASGGTTAFLGLLKSRQIGVVVLTNHGPDTLRRQNWSCSPGEIGIELLRRLSA